jgi:acyl dehydratase
MPDIFMNILTTNGLVGRLVTDWAGPDGQLRKISVKLGVPCFPGDTMRLTGSVVSAKPTDDGGLVEVAIRGANSRGDHVTGSVQVILP